MNTSEVAKLLGVSASTIQRWVKQLDLPMERNERGHYLFRQEDIDILRNIQDQLQKGILIQDIAPVKSIKVSRRGTVKAVEKDHIVEKLLLKVEELELGLNTKADSVVSYQILQHRREIEELQEQVSILTKELHQLKKQMDELTKPPVMEKPFILEDGKVKRKKKNFVSSLFGLL